MQREILYFKMLKSICDAADSPLTAQEKADFNTAMGAHDFDGCFDQLDNHTLPEKYKWIAEGVRYYRAIASLADIITTNVNVGFCDIHDDIHKIHLKPMVLNMPAHHLFVFSSCSLFEEDRSTVIDSTNHQQVWLGVEQIWNSIADDHAKESTFYDIIGQKQWNKVIVISSLVLPYNNETDIFKIYSFAYLNKLNEGRFPIPSVLRTNVQNYVTTPFNFNTNPYDQYYDVYNALNDAKHSENILTQFLHIYQALELLAYRMKLAKFVNSTTGMRQSVVMQLMSNAKSLKDDEIHSVKDLFKKVFTGIENQINSANLTTDCKRFLENNYAITFPHVSMSNENVATLVYRLRNSIVHNKDTELHFSFNNIDEYNDIIPVIKDLVVILPRAIINMINDNTTAKRKEVEYTKRDFPLY